MFSGRDPLGRRRAALDAAADETFTCPACGEDLILRAGPVRARHFAHRPGSACRYWATQRRILAAAERSRVAAAAAGQQSLFDLLDQPAPAGSAPAPAGEVRPARFTARLAGMLRRWRRQPSGPAVVSGPVLDADAEAWLAGEMASEEYFERAWQQARARVRAGRPSRRHGR